MTVIGRKGEGVGHGTLIGIEATVVAVGVEVFSSGKYQRFDYVVTDVLGDHESLGQVCRIRGG